MAPKIQTVLGDVDPSTLGRTLTHEHLSMDFMHFYTQPPKQLNFAFNHQIDLKNVGFVRQYPYSLKYNLVLNDNDSKRAVAEDLRLYKQFGGGAIVENSTEGLRRDLNFFVDVSKQTGVQVVSGTGFYIADMQEVDKAKYSKEDIYGHMLKELTEGCAENPMVKAGVIGEVASVWPIKPLETKAISATGEVQEQVGCGVTFHPHRNKAAPAEIIRLYLEAGGKADKAIMSHLDRTLMEIEDLLEFAKLGVICQFDLFGIEVSYYQLNATTDMPSDAQRLDKLKIMVDEGYEDRITISHDIHTKHRLTAFGGHGYSHIINNIIPRMKNKGFSQEAIDKITVHNPAKWLTIDK